MILILVFIFYYQDFIIESFRSVGLICDVNNETHHIILFHHPNKCRILQIVKVFWDKQDFKPKTSQMYIALKRGTHNLWVTKFHWAVSADKVVCFLANAKCHMAKGILHRQPNSSKQTALVSVYEKDSREACKTGAGKVYNPVSDIDVVTKLCHI